MLPVPDSQTRSSLISTVLVIAVLAFFAAVAGASPFVVPPAGISGGIGLAGFQIMLAAAAGLLALLLLVAASATGLFWPQFLHSPDDGRDALRSLQWAVLTLGVVIALVMAMVAIGFVGFATNTAIPPAWETVQNWLRGLIMVAVVAGVVCLVRAGILLARILSRCERA